MAHLIQWEEEAQEAMGDHVSHCRVLCGEVHVVRKGLNRLAVNWVHVVRERLNISVGEGGVKCLAMKGARLK